MHTATATASPNIAFIKYWGNRDDALRIPANGSISMNLGGLSTQTQVCFSEELPEDRFTLNGRRLFGPALERVSSFLDIVRRMGGREWKAEVTSQNNFPTGAGIASSASAFAALSLAASAAIGLELDEAQLSRLARRGSGSACRSVPGGFVEWLPGDRDENSYAQSIADAGYWPLTDCIALVSSVQKKIGSTAGHSLAYTSPLQAARVQDALRRLEICRRAIVQRDFDALSAVVELDSNLMHAVMMTSYPPLFYWEPLSLALMKQVPQWRKQGMPVCYTLDAGPNVHMICDPGSTDEVESKINQVAQSIRVIRAGIGGAAERVD